MTSSVKEEQKMAEFKQETPGLLPSNYGCEILIENGTWAQVTEKTFLMMQGSSHTLSMVKNAMI